MRWPDEEPDWHEDAHARVEFEFNHCAEFCERCGHRGHRGPECPTVNLLTLRKPT